ncbi:MAG TPA: N-acyl homoserine lactonase family protein, partial [Candidatus Dormibacteraeota bacterium]|nr:N-acyl homoserine lactonase family protein [Candidatus Dormibacteraeota bacterium]
MEIVRLHLARIDNLHHIPVHGFVIKHPRAGAILVDTGVGNDDEIIREWKVVNRHAADALAEHDLSPADVRIVINTHLHFDHCGQNAVFKHAPFYVQRAELDRARRESPALSGWFDFMGARFELLDGDAEILPGLSVIATPGHTVGHHCVVVETGDGPPDLLIGDAAYTPREYTGPLDQKLPPGQAADRPSWEASIGRVRSMTPSRVHFC